jgi:hypothetical protein
MASFPRPEISDEAPGIAMRELKWSAMERTIARRAFNRALKQELSAVVQKAKKMCEQIAEPCELWELENYLTRRRREIDRRYDYRYSILPLVFGTLIREGRLSEQDLQGLDDDKLRHVRLCAKPLPMDAPTRTLR